MSVDGKVNKVLVESQALKELPRHGVQLATKFGLVKVESNNAIVRGDPEYVRACCEGSLRRLGVEYIDLYYPHRIDTSVPIEETVSGTISQTLVTICVILRFCLVLNEVGVALVWFVSEWIDGRA